MGETKSSTNPAGLTLAQVRDSVSSYLSQGNAGYFHIGRLYNHTVSNKLAEKNGYANAQQFFRQEFKELSQATLSRCGAVARQFSEETCRKYGVMKLSVLGTHAQEFGLQLPAREPGGLLLEVPREGGRLEPKTFADCSLEEVRQAAKHKRRPMKAVPSESDTAHIDLLRNSFSRHFAQGARVQLKTSVQGGKTLLTIQGVPLERMEQLVEALLEGFQPQLVRSVG